jgi:hypothetical protein
MAWPGRRGAGKGNSGNRVGLGDPDPRKRSCQGLEGIPEKLSSATCFSLGWLATMAGGRSLGGPGESELGAGFALAGWDAASKAWIHVWYGEDGQYGRLEITRFDKDTYYGSVRVVEANGKVTSSQWEGKIISDDHFIITDRSENEVTVTHWHRMKKGAPKAQGK